QICGILPVYTGIPTTNNSFSPQTIGSVIFLRSKWYVSLSLQNLAAILFVIFWVVPAGLKSICFTNLYSFSILLFPIIITYYNLLIHYCIIFFLSLIISEIFSLL